MSISVRCSWCFWITFRKVWSCWSHLVGAFVMANLSCNFWTLPRTPGLKPSYTHSLYLYSTAPLKQDRKVLNRFEKQHRTELANIYIITVYIYTHLDHPMLLMYIYNIYIYLCLSIFLKVANLSMANSVCVYSKSFAHLISEQRWFSLPNQECPIAAFNSHWKSAIGRHDWPCIPLCRRGSDPFPSSKIHVTGETLRDRWPGGRPCPGWVPSKSIRSSQIVPCWEDEQILTLW